ncbi:MAG: nuclear transport factor 2 family protein [Fimbriimonadaceae bacterium]|nr:nuclear transport factor 2 family protein [Fimbriimonadaceae bacterium]
MMTLTTALACALTIPGLAQQEDPQLRREVQAFYNSFDRTLNAGNHRKLLDFFDPAWVMVGADNKTVTLAQMVEMGKSMKPGNLRSKIVVNSVQANGNEICAWITGTMSFRTSRRAKWMTTTERYAETIRRTPNGLKFVYAQALPNLGQWGWAKPGG